MDSRNRLREIAFLFSTAFSLVHFQPKIAHQAHVQHFQNNILEGISLDLKDLREFFRQYIYYQPTLLELELPPHSSCTAVCYVVNHLLLCVLNHLRISLAFHCMVCLD